MAYTKRQLELIANQLSDAYRQGEREILRLLRDAELTHWQQARAQAQLTAIREVLTALGGHTQEWGQLHLPGLYAAGMEAVGAVPTELSALHTESINLLGENLATRMGDALNIVGRTTDDVFRQAGLNALQETTILGETRREATRVMVNDLLDKGVTCFVDKAGKEWTLENYSSMVAETTTGEVQREGTINRMAELGDDLVQVSTHGDPCPLCEPWEGVVLSISGETEGYPTVDEAEAAGLFHPRCLHVLMPYSARYAEAV
ncbi:MAG: hypothetical protein PHV11_08790 [Candidatus Bipolaricaulis sp.]|nr:hypothetical protein [Candidatus Bipolaricaulis sp.]